MHAITQGCIPRGMQEIRPLKVAPFLRAAGVVQMKTLEAEAYQHAQQGKAELVKEKKAKAEGFRTACTGLRTTMEKIQEKLDKTR